MLKRLTYVILTFLCCYNTVLSQRTDARINFDTDQFRYVLTYITQYPIHSNFKDYAYKTFIPDYNFKRNNLKRVFIESSNFNIANDLNRSLYPIDSNATLLISENLLKESFIGFIPKDIETTKTWDSDLYSHLKDHDYLMLMSTSGIFYSDANFYLGLKLEIIDKNYRTSGHTLIFNFERTSEDDYLIFKRVYLDYGIVSGNINDRLLEGGSEKNPEEFMGLYPGARIIDLTDSLKVID